MSPSLVHSRSAISEKIIYFLSFDFNINRVEMEERGKKEGKIAEGVKNPPENVLLPF
jgi:hypothetical protein